MDAGADQNVTEVGSWTDSNSRTFVPAIPSAEVFAPDTSVVYAYFKSLRVRTFLAYFKLPPYPHAPAPSPPMFLLYFSS